MRQNKSKENLQQEGKKGDLLLKKNGFKHIDSSIITAKRGFSEPKINKIVSKKCDLGINDLDLALNNNGFNTKTIPEKNISNKKEEINDLKGDNIDIKDINSSKNKIKIQNTKIDNNNNNILYSNKYLNLKNLQEEIMLEINNADYVSNKLFADLNILIKEYPIIAKFNEELFLEKEDFEIFEEMEYTKFLLILNLSNIINIINLIYSINKGNISDFVSSLNKLKINFSYVKRKDEIVDLVLLTPKSSSIYNYISTYGESAFEDENFKTLAKSFLKNNNKTKMDMGYMFEDLSSLYLIELIKEENCEQYPNVIYYIKNTDKIINNKLISIPKPYYVSKLALSGKQGYNEIDLCIKMKEKCIIEPNYNFSKIDSGQELIENNKISLIKGNTYIIEIKTDIDLIVDKIVHINKIQDRFIESFKNVKINNKQIYDSQHYKKILVCNHNKSQAEDTISKTSSIQNKNILYMSFQVGISALLRINKNIRNLNEHIAEQDIKFNKKIDDLKNFINEKIKTIKQQNEELADIKIDLTIANSKIEELCTLALDSLRTFSENFIKLILNENYESPEKLKKNIESFLKAYECFKKVIKLMIRGKEDILPTKIFQFIDGKKDMGQNLTEWNNIKENIKLGIDKKNICSIYYPGLLDLLNNDQKLGELRHQQRVYIKNIIGFIYILEIFYKVENIENKFQGAIIYVLYQLMEEKVFLFSLKETIIQETKNFNLRSFINLLISCCI